MHMCKSSTTRNARAEEEDLMWSSIFIQAIWDEIPGIWKNGKIATSRESIKSHSLVTLSESKSCEFLLYSAIQRKIWRNSVLLLILIGIFGLLFFTASLC